MIAKVNVEIEFATNEKVTIELLEKDLLQENRTEVNSLRILNLCN
jgi:hypothetical protein